MTQELRDTQTPATEAYVAANLTVDGLGHLLTSGK